MENTHVKIYKGKGLKLHKTEKKNMKYELARTIVWNLSVHTSVFSRMPR